MVKKLLKPIYIIIEPKTSLIRLYNTCSHVWRLDLGRNQQNNPILHLDFTPYLILDPVTHRIIPSFKFRVNLEDPLEVASTDFINSLEKSFEVAFNNKTLQIQPLINVATWKFSQDTNRRIQKFPLQLNHVLKSIQPEFLATHFK